MSDVIGFVGLGSMGLPLATNLLESGYQLRIYNRTAAKTQSLVEKGAIAVTAPADVVEPGGIVISMLSNDQALEDVVPSEQGLLSTLTAESIHLSMSTVAPATAQKLATQHSQQGAHYLAAPVFGRPNAVVARKHSTTNPPVSSFR
jgi:3-hydroxyisobutyrate dehydrogenase-like beta-hydroxyacid dehydrogenase